MGLAGLTRSTCRRGDRAEETEVAGAWREKERKEMTGGVAVSVGGHRDAALRNVADGLARLVSGRRGNGARASGGCGEEALSCWADPEGRWAERGERKERDWASSRVGLAGWAGFWFPHLLQTQLKSNLNSNKI